ncbi:MAG: hypothetical protein QNJ30_01465 [Kiloniellales bacterium]|nr:hypothetical protein [Kiloniellales bacterium]
MRTWTQLPFRWRRSGLLVLSLLLFVLPWLALAGESYSGCGFRDLAGAVRAAAEGPLAAPIAWDLVILQPAAALAGLIVVQRGLSRKAADFLAAFAIFVGPLAIVMALYEVPEVSLRPAGYAVLALAALALVLDFRPGLATRNPEDPEAPGT